MTPPDSTRNGARRWYRAGAVLQGLVLGPLVTLALFNLIRMASGAKIFSYQGF